MQVAALVCELFFCLTGNAIELINKNDLLWHRFSMSRFTGHVSQLGLIGAKTS